MLQVNSVSFTSGNTKTVPNNVVESKNITAPKNDAQTDKKMSTKTKVVIGTGLTALAAVGIYIATKGRAGRKLGKEVKELEERLIKQEFDFKNHSNAWDKDLFMKEIEAINALPLKERMAKLKEIKQIFDNDRGLSTFVNNPGLYGNNLKDLPQKVEEAIKSTDRIKASKLYAEYCDTLFSESSVAGKDVAETLEKAFGKGHSVKPHDYDLSKEFESVATGENFGGFYTRIASKGNKIADARNRVAGKGLTQPGSCYPYGVGNKTSGDDVLSNIPYVQSGVTEAGQKYVGITYNGGNGFSKGFTLFAPKGQDFTPAQRDLLAIKPEQLTQAEIDTLERTPVSKGNANYDAILSVVRTLSEKFKV